MSNSYVCGSFLSVIMGSNSCSLFGFLFWCFLTFAHTYIDDIFLNFFLLYLWDENFFLNKGVYVIHYIYWLYLHKKNLMQNNFFLVFFKNLVRAQDQVTHHHQVPWECHLEWVCTLVCHPIMASAVSVDILVKLKDMCMIKFFLDLINHSLAHIQVCTSPFPCPPSLMHARVHTHTLTHAFIYIDNPTPFV